MCPFGLSGYREAPKFELPPSEKRLSMGRNKKWVLEDVAMTPVVDLW